MQSNRIRPFTQPSSDQAEIALLGVIQREMRRRQEVESENSELRALLGRCPACRVGVES